MSAARIRTVWDVTRENDCHECGQHVGPGIVYHPFLYCELYKGNDLLGSPVGLGPGF